MNTLFRCDQSRLFSGSWTSAGRLTVVLISEMIRFQERPCYHLAETCQDVMNEEIYTFLDGADLDFYCGVSFWSVCLISAFLFIAILLSVQQKDWYIITDPKVVWGPNCHKTSWSGPSAPPDRQTLSHSDSWQKQISPSVFVPLTGWTGSTALFLRL